MDVVNPIWLFTITCTVPPVRYPLSCDRFSVSATTPWPAKAASPWMSTGRMAARPSSPPIRSWRARAIPSTTGFTASRWLGLGDRVMRTGPPFADSWVPWAPRWYFTSPEPWGIPGSGFPWNSLKIREYGFPMFWVTTFSRPRWLMPRTISSTPSAAADSSSRSTTGMSVSPPSRLNRLWPTYRAWRNFSNDSERSSFLSTRFRSSVSRGSELRVGSMRSWSHFFCSGSWMCMYSTPIRPQ